MSLKICKCGLSVTTRNAVRVIRDDGLGVDAIYFNCPKCGSTMVLVSRKGKE